MKYWIHHYLLFSTPFLLNGCITPGGPSVTKHLHDMPNTPIVLTRDITVSREFATNRDRDHMQLVLGDKNSVVPKMIPKGTSFYFEDLKEEYDYALGIFPFFIGIGKTNERYTTWLKFTDYKISNAIFGDQIPLTLEYVWGTPGMIHAPPWEDAMQPIGKSKRDLIRHLDSSPLYKE